MPVSPKYDVMLTPTPSEVHKDHHDDKQDHNEKPSFSTRLAGWAFGVPGILVGALLGILIGYAVQTTKPSPEVVSWIGVPGDLFIRAVKCLVTPLVFCSLVVGMADMLAIGKAGAIGWRTFALYMLTTFLASVEGLIAVSIFRRWFGSSKKVSTETPVELAMACDQPGYFLSHINDTVACVFDETFNATGSHSSSSKFVVSDVNGKFALADSGFAKLTLSESLQAQLQSMVPSNITQAFADGALLSIIMFSIPFGVAIAILPRDMTLIASFFREVNLVFMAIIKWVIKLTPIAIISLLATSIAAQEDLSVLVSDVGVYILCDLITLSIHAMLVYPLLLRIFVKSNPYNWLRQIAPAQLFAMSCASSMATLPVTMECVEKTGEVTATVYRFVLSLGATINMDGAAIGYSIAIVFMAEAAGLGDIVGGVELFLIVLVSTIGAVGSAPVPSAGIVMTMTIWNSVFPSQPLPSTFAFIVATDWFLDRFQTAVNVTGDTVITRIVAEHVGEMTLPVTNAESPRQNAPSCT